MQKIMMLRKNNKGVTLAALVTTIIVLFIIFGITLNYGLSEIHDVANKKTESELGIIQEAIMQRYALVKSSNQLGIVPSSTISNNTTLENDTGRPKGFLGTRLYSSQEISSNGFSGVTPLKEYDRNNNTIPYEQYYYLLTQNDLLTLGVEKGAETNVSDDVTPKDRSYIVNYYTGEVFDVANKKYYKTDTSNDDLIYKQPTSVNIDSKNYVFDDN